ncbi:Filamentous hemagglutinin transporter protein FhaC [Labeo rohita]|uniref:Filamentous hemagglutinin transporter protein FhaC n=1 Tax=Labeo rohita TaxID=84645 RepID=A0ABQ8LMD6_LABRO|nr:Filamentous hemagglutinin transporter protein FhaC [Labeo rohita]
MILKWNFPSSALPRLPVELHPNSPRSALSASPSPESSQSSTRHRRRI